MSVCKLSINSNLIIVFSICGSSDKLPTLLAYLDTSEKSQKILGHMEVELFDEVKSAVIFNNGEYLFKTIYIRSKILFILSKNLINI